MYRKIFLFYLFTLLAVNSKVYPLDWKALHEKADNITVAEAKTNVLDGSAKLEGLYVLGLVYLNVHNDEQAAEAFRDLLVLNPSLPEAQWGLAEVYRRKKELTESEIILNRLIDKYPDFIPPYITLAYLRYTQAKFDKAVKLSQEVLRRGRVASDLSNFTRAHLIYAGSKGMIASRGGPLSKLINGTRVLPHLKKAEDLQPNSAEVLFGLGNFYFLAPHIAGGDLDKALGYLNRAVEADPLLVDAYVRLAQVYRVLGRRKEYSFYLDKAKSLDSENDLLKDELSGECIFNCQTVED